MISHSYIIYFFEQARDTVSILLVIDIYKFKGTNRIMADICKSPIIKYISEFGNIRFTSILLDTQNKRYTVLPQ
jgi:hypothetical protein